jgi:hypothetical protein
MASEDSNYRNLPQCASPRADCRPVLEKARSRFPQGNGHATRPKTRYRAFCDRKLHAGTTGGSIADYAAMWNQSGWKARPPRVRSIFIIRISKCNSGYNRPESFRASAAPRRTSSSRPSYAVQGPVRSITSHIQRSSLFSVISPARLCRGIGRPVTIA